MILNTLVFLSLTTIDFIERSEQAASTHSMSVDPSGALNKRSVEFSLARNEIHKRLSKLSHSFLMDWLRNPRPLFVLDGPLKGYVNSLAPDAFNRLVSNEIQKILAQRNREDARKLADILNTASTNALSHSGTATNQVQTSSPSVIPVSDFERRDLFGPK